MISSQQFYDYRSLAGLSSDPERNNLTSIVIRLVLGYLCECFNGFVRVQLGQIHLARLFKSLFKFLTDRHDFTLINDVLRKLVEELFLTQALNAVFKKILQEAELGVLSILQHVGRECVIRKVYGLKRHAIRIVLFQIVREVSVKNVGQNRLRLLGIIRLKVHTLDHYAIFEEENLHWVECLKLFHTILIGDNFLLLCDEVELFDAAGEHYSVDLRGKIIPVGWRLMVKLLLDGISLELAVVAWP